MIKGFKAFILRGNVIELAIAVVIGLAFTAVVTAVVKDLLTPLIAAIFGEPNFGNLSFTIHNSTFAYGDVINALISFLLIAAVIYYMIVVPMNVLAARMTTPAALTTRVCPECLNDVPKAARRCGFCGQAVTPVV